MMLEQERLCHQGPKILVLSAQPGVKKVTTCYDKKSIFVRPSLDFFFLGSYPSFHKKNRESSWTLANMSLTNKLLCIF